MGFILGCWSVVAESWEVEGELLIFWTARWKTTRQVNRQVRCCVIANRSHECFKSNPQSPLWPHHNDVLALWKAPGAFKFWAIQVKMHLYSARTFLRLWLEAPLFKSISLINWGLKNSLIQWLTGTFVWDTVVLTLTLLFQHNRTWTNLSCCSHINRLAPTDHWIVP